MNGKEKKEFYLEYIYSLRMDVYRIIKSVIGGCECYGGADADRAGKSLAFYRIGSQTNQKQRNGLESDHEEMFCVITFAEKSESRETGLMKIPRRLITIKVADYLEPDPLSIGIGTRGTEPGAGGCELSCGTG